MERQFTYLLRALRRELSDPAPMSLRESTEDVRLLTLPAATDCDTFTELRIPNCDKGQFIPRQYVLGKP